MIPRHNAISHLSTIFHHKFTSFMCYLAYEWNREIPISRQFHRCRMCRFQVTLCGIILAWTCSGWHFHTHTCTCCTNGSWPCSNAIPRSWDVLWRVFPPINIASLCPTSKKDAHRCAAGLMHHKRFHVWFLFVLKITESVDIIIIKYINVFGEFRWDQYTEHSFPTEYICLLHSCF